MSSLTLTTSLAGGKITLIRKWNPAEAARLIKQERLTSAGGCGASFHVGGCVLISINRRVPSMAADLIESALKGYDLDSLTWGGAPAASIFTTRARRAFPNVTLFVLSFLARCVTSTSLSQVARVWFQHQVESMKLSGPF